MLQLTTFLTHQNGSIHEGLNLWKKNVDKRFEGVEVSLVDISKRDKETVYGTLPYPLVLLKKIYSHVYRNIPIFLFFLSAVYFKSDKSEHFFIYLLLVRILYRNFT